MEIIELKKITKMKRQQQQIRNDLGEREREKEEGREKGW